MTHLILPKNVDSKFRFITVAAQRAKQLQNGAKPRVEARSRKPTRVAMQEVLAEAVSWEIRDEPVPVAVVPAGSTLRLLEQHAAATQRYRQLSIRSSPRSVTRLVEEIRAVC